MAPPSTRTARASKRTATAVPVAEYLRMSTEHQQYSLDNQACVLRVYAAERGFAIVRSYIDAARSGLRLQGRPALQSLLADIADGSADYKAVLVYDVSRWGRFQDPDEAATYELRCRRSGVAIHYCAEQFENDGSVSSSIIKAVKRAMAAEYSRELSVKVFAGQARLARLGFKLGGRCMLGMRRLLVDEAGKAKFELRKGEEKSIATDRVVLVPGPADEIAVVQRIFEMFADEGLGETAIARHLNQSGIANHNGTPWTRDIVMHMLKYDAYAGHVVWARTSIKLQTSLRRNAPETWIRREGAYDAIIDQALFDRAQARTAARANKMTKAQMVDWLREILAKSGRLSEDLIHMHVGPTPYQIRWRFGSLHKAYAAAGYVPHHQIRYLDLRRRLETEHPQMLAALVAQLRDAGVDAELDHATRTFVVNGRTRVAFFVLHCVETWQGQHQWPLPIGRLVARGFIDADLLVARRLQPASDAVLDHYVLPRS